MSHTGTGARASTSSSRTAYGAPLAPVIASTTGNVTSPSRDPRDRRDRSPYDPIQHRKPEHNQAHHPVHREERRVESRQVAGPDEVMFPREDPRRNHHADEVPDPEACTRTEDDERGDRDSMKQLRDHDRALLAERHDRAVQPARPVEMLVRERVEHVEPRDPGRDGKGDRKQDPPGAAPRAGD